ncbi:MAG: RNA polymerase sigma-D factor [bacterium ADurb.Bin270]|nr:MAG: RNA polymerase sigma-D factor [bacterium ADurb.Bin270]
MSKTAVKNDRKLSAKRDLEARARVRASVAAKKAADEVRALFGNKQATKKEIAELRRRDDLINQYMPYAASIANRVCQSLSSAVDYEEVLCNARLGLLEAAKRFDDTQEVDFRTFAYYRIKGAIYDGLRRSGWLPRTLYAKIKFEEAANEYLQNKSLNHSGTIAAEARKKEGDKSEENAVAETVNSIASIYIISLDAHEEMEVEDADAVNVEHRAEFMQIRRHMRDAIGSLPEKEKQLIMMYYFQNRTLEEVGVKLGLSKSWTSRLHARALSLLFKRIRNRAVGGQGNEVMDEE